MMMQLINLMKQFKIGEPTLEGEDQLEELFEQRTKEKDAQRF